MKKVLITGTTGYVALKQKEWLSKYSERYEVTTICLRDNSWRNKDLSQYDVLIHTSGIAHIKEKNQNKHLYFEINRDLAYEVAKKAKKEGIHHFVFLSSMSVYGLENGVIDNNTLPIPKTFYGESKLQAEKLILSLEDDLFIVSIIRPPMIYGESCKGNYPKLAKLALKTPLFPEIENKRSMLHIDNLNEFIKNVVDHSSKGIFFPQNKQYVNTSELVHLIAEFHGKKISKTKFFNPLLRLLSRINTINKLFGDLVYDKEISKYFEDYDVNNFKSSIFLTERNN